MRLAWRYVLGLALLIPLLLATPSARAAGSFDAVLPSPPAVLIPRTGGASP